MRIKNPHVVVMYLRATADYLNAYGWTTGWCLYRGHTVKEALSAVVGWDRKNYRAAVRAFDSYLLRNDKVPWLSEYGRRHEGQATNAFNVESRDKRRVLRALLACADEIEKGASS